MGVDIFHAPRSQLTDRRRIGNSFAIHLIVERTTFRLRHAAPTFLPLALPGKRHANIVQTGLERGDTCARFKRSFCFNIAPIPLSRLVSNTASFV
jgi:hypothetical protein